MFQSRDRAYRPSDDGDKARKVGHGGFQSRDRAYRPSDIETAMKQLAEQHSFNPAIGLTGLLTSRSNGSAASL